MSATSSFKKDHVKKFVINTDSKEYNDYKFKVEIITEIKTLKEQIEFLQIELNKVKEKINV
jgi:hypothetical protein